ncbi:YgcG family protein [Mesorhizobium sp. LHD-90]|uniref:TPM domain-containing protein n=1 Tax=Mesorhizobium sp. LHD-90 TaxID=3071414 RepID=UPI0027DF9EED|nr:YgcG family protein [Mesorhizobium sp. LHD-90]MDQ6432591.1 YgcG family protein [Mesorhizobium sp. LHD-90]
MLLLFSLPGLAADLPKLTGRIVDAAGMIDPATETALTQKLEAFEKKSSDQIVVATIDSLDGEAIEPYANRLFRAWGLGQGGEDNGILLLVAKNDRKMRIEVGYGLEGTLTDLHSKLIIDNTMVPAFRAGDFSGGISRAADDIVMVLEGNAAELEARARRNPPADNTFADVDWIFVVFIALWATIFLGGMAMAILPPIFGTKIGPNRYRWLGMDITVGGRSRDRSSGGWSSGGGGWSSGGGGWSSGGGGFSGGGGSSGGGGASGSW